MRSLMLVVLLATPVAAQVTQAQKDVMIACYFSDADARSKGPQDQVVELLNFIFLGRAAQKTQLTTVLQRCRDRLTAQQATYDAGAAAGRTSLDAAGTATDGALSAVPSLP